MIEVIVVGEGQTEEGFVRDLLAPALWSHEISLEPRLIPTSQTGRGGALTRDRVMRYLRNTLRERDDTYVTTMFDLYRLDSRFPGVQESAHINDPIERAKTVEAHFAEVVVEEAQRRADRFLPHIQPHEFEALLFSDVDRLVEQELEWRSAGKTLHAIRAVAASPEHINAGDATHPAARLGALSPPPYKKSFHGPLIVARSGLPRIRQECGHFAAWLDRLEHLPAL